MWIHIDHDIVFYITDYIILCFATLYVLIRVSVVFNQITSAAVGHPKGSSTPEGAAWCSRALEITLRSSDQHQHRPGVCEKCRRSDPSPDPTESASAGSQSPR